MPTPTGGLTPRSYPVSPEPVTQETAREFAPAFERVVQHNTFLVERGDDGYGELTVSVRTEWVRQEDDGIVVHVEGEIDAADTQQTATSQTSAPTLRQPFSTWLYLTAGVGLRHSIGQATPEQTDPTFRTADVIYCADDA